jgi:hypothetical protein
MPDTFTQFRQLLDAVDRWLPVYLASELSAKERALAMSLQRYVSRCRRDVQKWRSESAAERAILKINRMWYQLYFRK